MTSNCRSHSPLLQEDLEINLSNMLNLIHAKKNLVEGNWACVCSNVFFGTILNNRKHADTSNSASYCLPCHTRRKIVDQTCLDYKYV